MRMMKREKVSGRGEGVEGGEEEERLKAEG